MDYEKAYKKALERAKEIKSKIFSSYLSTESCKAVSEYIDEIIPELRESEDERIMEKIKKCIIYDCSLSREETDEMLAYLEKQKESKLLNNEKYQTVPVEILNRLYASERELQEIKQKEQKPKESTLTDFEQKLYTVISIFVGEYERDKEADLIKFVKEYSSDLLESAKEQKPVEHHWEQMEWADIDFDEFTENVRHLIIDKLTTSLPSVGGGKLTSTVFIDDKTAKEIANGILFFIGPQKPVEWSEEETKDLIHILKVLDDCYIYGKHDLSKTDYDNLTSTLKSLRPSWKPSEEQIKALWKLMKYAVSLSSYYGIQKEIESLYEDLVTLKGGVAPMKEVDE